MKPYVPEILLWLFVINLGIASGTGLYERIGTFSYFIPTALKLMHAETLPVPSVEAIGSQWVLLNHVRATLTLAGWLAALRAFSLPR